MDEFSIISHYFQLAQSPDPNLIIAGGDDCAVIEVPSDSELLVSTDTLVSGTHFLDDFPVKAIVTRAMTANISDICAMGGEPRWLSLSLTLNNFDKDWLSSFSDELYNVLARENVQLIGGDLARGPLSISVTIQGLCKKGQSIKRSGAAPGDVIYVSNHLGDVAHALTLLEKSNCDYQDPVFNKLFYPSPQSPLALIVSKYASSCIDLSDGLTQDLQHLLNQSRVGAHLYESQIPISEDLLKQMEREVALNLALNSGEEFELCFTIPKAKENAFLNAVKAKALKVSPIGEITKSRAYLIEDEQGKINSVKVDGYKHF